MRNNKQDCHFEAVGREISLFDFGISPRPVGARRNDVDLANLGAAALIFAQLAEGRFRWFLFAIGVSLFICNPLAVLSFQQGTGRKYCLSPVESSHPLRDYVYFLLCAKLLVKERRLKIIWMVKTGPRFLC